MSNHLAVATVTATLRHMLLGPVKQGVDNSDVVTDRPPADGGEPDQPEVRIFLYSVLPNAAWRNADLPTRRASGDDLAQRPQAALDLNYLLSFYGNERNLEPQRLLGIVARELHARPLLSRDHIRRMIADALVADPGTPLQASDLADQPELVRFTPLALDLDEMSKLWSVFFQAPYRLAVAYQASVVLISPDSAPRPTLPVQDRRIYTVTIRRPVIERVEAASGPRDPVSAGTEVRILGSQLRGEITAVWFGATPANLVPEAVGDREIRAVVPAPVRSGLAGVRIEHRMLMGDPPEERSAGTSNIAPLVIVPRIRQAGGAYQVSVADVVATGDLRAGTLNVTVDPAVGNRQRVLVSLNQIDPPPDETPASYRFADASRDIEGAPETANALSVPFVDVRAGTYLVRVQVDGAESPLDRDLDRTSPTFERYVAPTVSLP
jgi:hypothetical protein